MLVTQANIVDPFNGPVPDAAVIDTCSMIYAYGTSYFVADGLPDARPDLCADYERIISRLVQNQTVCVYTDQILDEIHRVCQVQFIKKFRNANKANWRLRKMSYKEIFEYNPQLYKDSANLFEQIAAEIDAAPHLVKMHVERDLTFQQIAQQVRNEALLEPNDIVLASFSISSCVNSIVTHDGHFRYVKGINIYTTNPAATSQLSNQLVSPVDALSQYGLRPVSSDEPGVLPAE